MDIEKLMKVNSLSKELQRHGLTSNRDESIGMAGNIIDAPDETQFSRIVSIKAPEQQTDNKHSEQGPSNREPQEKRFGKQEVIDILQRFADQFSTEVNMLNEKFQTQSEIINDLRMQLKSLGEQGVREEKEGKSPEVNVAAPQEDKNDQKSEQSSEQEKPNPKNGGFTNEDVAIDKIFYCGTR